VAFKNQLLNVDGEGKNSKHPFTRTHLLAYLRREY